MSQQEFLEFAAILQGYHEVNNKNSQDNKNDFINDNSNQIIEYLGGMSNILNLCLTNKDANKQISLNNFNQLKNLFSNYKNPDSDPNVQLSKDKKSTLIKQNKKPIINEINSKQYLECSKITNVIIDTRNNFYFLFLPNNIANTLHNNTVLKHKIILYSTIIGVLMIFIGILWYYLPGYEMNTFAYTYVLIREVYFLILIIMIMFSLNIEVCKIVIDKFDFWFKIYNSITLILSSNMLRFATKDDIYFTDYNGYNYYAVSVLWDAFIFVVFLVIFLIDALLIKHPKYKLIFLGSIGCFFAFMIVWEYFEINDYIWNPFESYNFKYTQISFKSMYLSSMVNLTLFILKPVFSNVYIYCRKKINIKKKAIDSDSKQLKQQVQSDNNDSFVLVPSYTIYKRPYLKWINVKKCKLKHTTSEMHIIRNIQSIDIDSDIDVQVP